MVRLYLMLGRAFGGSPLSMRSIARPPDLLDDACAGGLSSTCEVNAWNNLSGDRIEVADDPVTETVARTPMVPRCF